GLAVSRCRPATRTSSAGPLEGRPEDYWRIMRTLFSKTVAGGCVLAAVLTVAAISQAPAAAQGGQTPVAWPGGVGPGSAASPTYVRTRSETAENNPAAEVWKRVGKFCDIAEWLRIANCTITAGKDGEVGAVRSVAGEVLVAKTELSYTYTQTPMQQA